MLSNSQLRYSELCDLDYISLLLYLLSLRRLCLLEVSCGNLKGNSLGDYNQTAVILWRFEFWHDRLLNYIRRAAFSVLCASLVSSGPIPFSLDWTALYIGFAFNYELCGVCPISRR